MNATDVITSLTAAAVRLAGQLAAFVPSLLAALGLLVAGWLIGWLLARGITKLIDTLAPGLEERATRLTVARLGVERRLAELAGRFVFWIVLVVFAVAAVEALRLMESGRRKVYVLPVVDETRSIMGLVRMHDLATAQLRALDSDD